MLKTVLPALAVLSISTGVLAQTTWPPGGAASSQARDALQKTLGTVQEKPALPGTPPLQQLDTLQKAVTDAWERMPLTTRRAIFVSSKPLSYGSWVQRPSSVFKPGEEFLVYVEPVGYAWKPNGDSFDFGIAGDLILKSPDGKVLGGQENFIRADFSSRTKMQELMLNITVSLDGIDPGSYVMKFKIRDVQSDKATTIALPFTLAP